MGQAILFKSAVCAGGKTTGYRLALKVETALALADLRTTHEAWLPELMGG
ncbi:MAG: hypothetical protein K2X41_13750 [Hyphomicrobium sp.]|nr:hypothetical protein [Hyphomicrobium sp.]